MTAFQPNRSYSRWETSVRDGVLHHGTFNNQHVVELAVSKHSGTEWATPGSHLHNVTKVNGIYHGQRFFLQLFFFFHHDVGDRVGAEACKETTLKQVTDIEEWNDSTYTNCELKWKDKGENTEYKGGDSQRGVHSSCSFLRVGGGEGVNINVKLVPTEKSLSQCRLIYWALQLQCFLTNTFIYCRKEKKTERVRRKRRSRSRRRGRKKGQETGEEENHLLLQQTCVQQGNHAKCLIFKNVCVGL